MRQTFVICKYIPYAIAFATFISSPLNLDRGENPRTLLHGYDTSSFRQKEGG